MRSLARHRARGQTLVFAAISMVAIIGAVGMVVDFGVFFVIQRQMQSAANAAALAAVWYSPVCNASVGPPPSPQLAAGCQPGPAVCPPGPPVCPPPDCLLLPVSDQAPCTIAHQFATANLGPVGALCRGPLNVSEHPGVEDLHVNPYPAGNAPDPGVNVYAVTIECDAQRWFGRILPGIGFSNHILTTGTATIGWLGANGDLSIVPQPLPATPTLIARLVESHPPPP